MQSSSRLLDTERGPFPTWLNLSVYRAGSFRRRFSDLRQILSGHLFCEHLSLPLLLCEWLAVAATPDPLTLSASMPTIAQLRRQEGEGRDRVLLPVWDLGMGRRQQDGLLAHLPSLTVGESCPPLSLKFRGRPRLTSRAMSSFILLERVSERGRCSS